MNFEKLKAIATPVNWLYVQVENGSVIACSIFAFEGHTHVFETPEAQSIALTKQKVLRADSKLQNEFLAVLDAARV